MPLPLIEILFLEASLQARSRTVNRIQRLIVTLFAIHLYYMRESGKSSVRNGENFSGHIKTDRQGADPLRRNVYVCELRWTGPSH